MKKSTWVVLGVIIVALAAWLIVAPGKSSKLDAFATCLGDKGVKFYGAFWCPHCQAQKALFGASVDKLPYVECSTPDGNSQNQTCNAEGIESYPTWVFPNGARVSGEQTLEYLSATTSCPLPQ